MGTKANKIWFLAVTVLNLFGLAGCFAAQLNQGQQQESGETAPEAVEPILMVALSPSIVYQAPSEIIEDVVDYQIEYQLTLENISTKDITAWELTMEPPNAGQGGEILQQEGCDVKIWNEYQYFAICPAEDTALIPAGQKREEITFTLETSDFASSTIENAEDSICVTITTADGETIQYPLRLTMLMFHAVDPEDLS